VSIAINNVVKLVVPLALVALVGCAGHPVADSGYKPADMQNFRANCAIAQIQIDSLNRNIADYLEYFRTRKPTLEDQRYFGRLKNNIWSLRSSCFENSR
jgi:hypothetical protein